MKLAIRYLPASVAAWACIGSLAWVIMSAPAFGQSMNGFDLRDALIPVDEIHFGGPPKDGIPAIDNPKFVTAGFAAYLRNDDVLLGLKRHGVVRAYPLKILNWHEVVNDELAGEPVAVTYCPLCGTGVAFSARVNGRSLSFGVSGLLYNSDVLLYDRQTQSLWSQLLGQAVSGPLKGSRLGMLPLTQTRWADWRTQEPSTQVLSTSTGQARPYMRDPYAGYEDSAETYFPVNLPITFRSAGFHPKSRVLGIVLEGVAKAYPFGELQKSGGARGAAAGNKNTRFEIRDRLGGHVVTIKFDAQNQRAEAFDAGGAQLPGVVGYWFAWYAFNPGTLIYRADHVPD